MTVVVSQVSSEAGTDMAWCPFLVIQAEEDEKAISEALRTLDVFADDAFEREDVVEQAELIAAALRRIFGWSVSIASSHVFL